MVFRFLRFIAGVKPKQTFILGRPFPTNLKKYTALHVIYDQRLAAGIFYDPPRTAGGDRVYHIAIWKSYKNKAEKWIVSTGFFPDEIDRVLRLLEDCRRTMPLS